MLIDSTREVKVDGQLGVSAVGFFDQVSENRDPKTVVNWSVMSRIIAFLSIDNVHAMIH